MRIFPSIICGDLLNLEKEISRLENICDGFHIDVMDDHFVPNLTIGSDFVNAIAHKTARPCHVHLMVDDPMRWISRLRLKKFDVVIAHIECFTNDNILSDFISIIHKANLHVGLALNPETQLSVSESILSNLDMILIMSVKPGFSGQKFIPEIMEKVKILVNMKKRYASLKVAIDGGIDKINIRPLVELGIDEFCIGSAVFASNNPQEAIQELRVQVARI